MSDELDVYGMRADGSTVLIGTAPLTPDMKRKELAREQFGHFSPDSLNDADLCLYALETYHAWLVAQGWQGPALKVTPK